MQGHCVMNFSLHSHGKGRSPSRIRCYGHRITAVQFHSAAWFNLVCGNMFNEELSRNAFHCKKRCN